MDKKTRRIINDLKTAEKIFSETRKYSSDQNRYGHGIFTHSLKNIANVGNVIGGARTFDRSGKAVLEDLKSKVLKDNLAEIDIFKLKMIRKEVKQFRKSHYSIEKFVGEQAIENYARQFYSVGARRKNSIWYRNYRKDLRALRNLVRMNPLTERDYGILQEFLTSDKYGSRRYKKPTYFTKAEKEEFGYPIKDKNGKVIGYNNGLMIMWTDKGAIAKWGQFFDVEYNEQMEAQTMIEAYLERFNKVEGII